MYIDGINSEPEELEPFVPFNRGYKLSHSDIFM
jgi:hypothetical protein